MNEKYECAYPAYRIDLPPGLMERCVGIIPQLLQEVGFLVRHSRFLSHLEGKKGVRIDGARVYFEKDLVQEYIDAIVVRKTEELRKRPKPTSPATNWTVRTDGFSMMILDVETEQLRPATCQDLREMIRLANSFGIGGNYMVMPQDIPPLMRTIACFKICFETSDNVRPYDYQQPEQIPFLYEMHQVMGRPMDITLTIPSTLSVDPKDIDIFMDCHPLWKRDRKINFVVLDYPMTGITKPISVPGCATMCFAETLALHILFNLFDPEIELDVSWEGGLPTDMRHACWAFGSPRAHLYRYLNSRVLPNLCRTPPEAYSIWNPVHLETGSPAVDQQAAVEKTANALLGALQGARNFCYAGVLCVDDVYSGTQFVIDLEIVNYVRDMIEAFDPHPDILNVDGLYEECRDVGLGKDMFLSHPHTASRCRHILPSSDFFVREKLRSWLEHRILIKDRAREIAMDRIRRHPSFRLPEDKQTALDAVYAKARKALAGEASQNGDQP
jgi:trimethylamine:corrinoid methyltransferase-like protein